MDSHITIAALLALTSLAACGGASQDAQDPSTATAQRADDPPQGKVDDTATLDVYGNPPTNVLVDGQPAGTTPVKGFKVKPGSHDVTWVDDVSGNRTMTVTLEPGDGKVMTSDRPGGVVRTETPPPSKPGKPGTK